MKSPILIAAMLLALSMSSAFCSACTAQECWTTYLNADVPFDLPDAAGPVVDREGQLWLKSPLYQLTDTGWTFHGDGPNWASAIMFDTANTAWVASWTGLYHYDGASWTNWNASNSNLPNDTITTLVLKCCQPMVVCGDSIYLFEDSVFTGITELPAGAGSIAVNIAGWIFAGSSNNGLHYFDGTFWGTYHSGNSPLPSNTASHLQVDAGGRVWFISQDDIPVLVRVSGGGGFTIYRPDGVLESWAGHTLTRLSIGFDNQVWGAVIPQNPSIVRFDPDQGWDVYNHTFFTGISSGTTLVEVAGGPDGEGWLLAKATPFSQAALTHIAPAAQPAPTITIDPATTICPGDTATISVGDPNLATSWYDWPVSQQLHSGNTFSTDTMQRIMVLAGDTGNCYYRDTFSIRVTEPYSHQTLCMVSAETGSHHYTVVWDNAPDSTVASYRIYREIFVVGNYELVAEVSAQSAGAWTDSSTSALQYPESYRISVLDSCGNESPLSANHRGLHLVAELGQDGLLNLSWNDYEGATISAYYISQHQFDGSFAVIDTVPGNVTSYTDLQPPPAYSAYFVQAAGPDGCLSSGTSDARIRSNIAVHDPTSTTEPRATVLVEVFPNPASTQVTLRTGSEVIHAVRVTDLSGRQLEVPQIMTAPGSVLLDVSHLSTGTYHLAVEFSNTVVNRPLLICR